MRKRRQIEKTWNGTEYAFTSETRYIYDGKLVIGICNGFQILVKAGILPGFSGEGQKEFCQEATLTTNDSGKFEDRWIHLKQEAPRLRSGRASSV